MRGTMILTYKNRKVMVCRWVQGAKRRNQQKTTPSYKRTIMTKNQNVTGIETLRWKNGCLEMIDQRILPASFEYIKYDSAASVADGIRSMVVRGAPAIGCAAAYGVALEALKLKDESKGAFNKV